MAEEKTFLVKINNFFSWFGNRLSEKLQNITNVRAVGTTSGGGQL
jgi:hypothetical protein